MKTLLQQIRKISSKLDEQQKKINACEILTKKGSHHVKMIGYIYGKIDYDGTIGRIDIYRCECGFEVQQVDQKMDLPKGYELNKIYSYGNIQAL